jgi:1-acyl-sn-glycerol-3-phosphate acyltransferase
MSVRNVICLVRFVTAWVFALGVGVAGCIMACVVGPTRMWLTAMPFWSCGILQIVNIRLRIDGIDNMKGPGIYISNHASLMDVVILPAIVPPTTRIVAKRELLYVPFVGWAFGVGGAVLIDRRNARSAVARLRTALASLPRGWSLMVFPEGTRSTNGQLRPFKKGAFHMAIETKLPLIPIGLDGTQDVSPAGRWLVRGGEVRICVGAPIPTETWSNADLNAPMQQGRAAVQACIDRAVAMRQAPHIGVPFISHRRS